MLGNKQKVMEYPFVNRPRQSVLDEHSALESIKLSALFSKVVVSQISFPISSYSSTRKTTPLNECAIGQAVKVRC